MYVVTQIVVEGFGSYIKAQTLTLGGRGPTAIAGANGAGKSTIASKAITWCFYGKATPERMGANTSALRGKQIMSAPYTYVLVDLLRGETGVRIVREREGRKGDVIRINGVVATQEEIEAIVGVDYDIWCRTCVRGQNDPWNWVEATDSRKREILERVSGAHTLAITHERAKQLCRKADQEKQLAQARVDTAQRNLGTVDTTALKAQAAAWDQQRQANVDSIEREIVDLESSLAALQSHSAADPIPDPTERMEMATKRLAAVREERRQVEAVYHPLRERERSLAHLVPGQDCPTCGQQIGPHAPITAKREEITARLAVVLPEMDRLSSAVEATESWEREMRDWAMRCHAARAESRGEQDRMDALGRAVEQARARLAAAQSTMNPFRTAIQQAEEQERLARQQLDLHEEALRLAEHEYVLASAWEDTLHPKGVRAHLAESALYAIEAEANRWLSTLSAGSMSLKINVRTEGRKSREEITVKVHQGSDCRDLLTFSGGERARINFAVDMGIAEVFARGGHLRVSLLVLDEALLSGLDVEGKRAVVDAIHRSGVADVLVVDHDPVLRGALPRTVLVERTSEGSIIKEI